MTIKKQYGPIQGIIDVCQQRGLFVFIIRVFPDIVVVPFLGIPILQCWAVLGNVSGREGARIVAIAIIDIIRYIQDVSLSFWVVIKIADIEIGGSLILISCCSTCRIHWNKKPFVYILRNATNRDSARCRIVYEQSAIIIREAERTIEFDDCIIEHHGLYPDGIIT